MDVSLSELAVRYGSDKGHQRVEEGAGFYGQRYADMYERWCAPRRDQPVTILEIGVHEGASIKMWADYMTQAKVIGIDTGPLPNVSAYGDRVRLFNADQYDVGALKSLVTHHGPFELIVDDGCHEVEAQLCSARMLLPHVRAGGWYCIEDIHSLTAVADGLRDSGCDMRLFPSAKPDERWWLLVLEVPS